MSGVEKSMPQRMVNPKQESIFGRGAGGTSLRMHHQRWKDPPCYQWVNPLFLWSMVSIAMLNYQKGQSTDVETAMLKKNSHETSDQRKNLFWIQHKRISRHV
jgi:hypothetical protein